MTKGELLAKIDGIVDKFDNITDEELAKDYKDYYGGDCGNLEAYKFGLLLGTVMNLRHEIAVELKEVEE